MDRGNQNAINDQHFVLPLCVIFGEGVGDLSRVERGGADAADDATLERAGRCGSTLAPEDRPFAYVAQALPATPACFFAARPSAPPPPPQGARARVEQGGLREAGPALQQQASCFKRALSMLARRALKAAAALFFCPDDEAFEWAGRATRAATTSAFSWYELTRAAAAGRELAPSPAAAVRAAVASPPPLRKQNNYARG